MAIQTSRATRGMATAPHSLASESAVAVLREGGNAVEAMIAAAANQLLGDQRIHKIVYKRKG